MLVLAMEFSRIMRRRPDYGTAVGGTQEVAGPKTGRRRLRILTLKEVHSFKTEQRTSTSDQLGVPGAHRTVPV